MRDWIYERQRKPKVQEVQIPLELPVDMPYWEQPQPEPKKDETPQRGVIVIDL